MWSQRRERRRNRVLIIVQNLPVPMDRRVWQEAQALSEAGVGVSVICPRGEGQPLAETLDGVRLHRYPAPPATSGPLSYVVEFAYCWLATAVWSVVVWVRHGFGALQACNPPDSYFALAAIYQRLGVRFVFDQHDLCPEVFQSRFAGEPGALGRILDVLEQLTYRCADHVILPNESYRRIAIERGDLDPAATTVVRNGPDLCRLRPGPPEPALRRGRAHLLCYLGVMGPQDGVDVLLRALSVLVHERGRDDVHVTLMGFGDSLEMLQGLTDELDLRKWVEFTGAADTDLIVRYLSTADVGLCPDPKDAFNDVSTMNKTMEYMAFGVPCVTFDLTETRVSAGEAAAYVADNDPLAFAREIDLLLDDAPRRQRMGAIGRERIERQLAWHHQRDRYVDLYGKLLGDAGASAQREPLCDG